MHHTWSQGRNRDHPTQHGRDTHAQTHHERQPTFLPPQAWAGVGLGVGEPPQQGLNSSAPCSGITWAMLATKKGSQVTKNMPSRMPRVRLAFKAFLLCLVVRRLLSADSTPGRGVLGTCRKESHASQLRKSPCQTLTPSTD